MKNFAVYHHTNESEYNSYRVENFNKDLDHNKIELPKKPIAMIEANTLDEVYQRTNHIDSSWFGELKEGIMLLVRSSMVGDVFYDTQRKEAWVVASFGFEPYNGDRQDWY